MDINEVYQKVKQKVNKNLTNDNVSIDKPRFVYLWNEAQNKYLEWVLEKSNQDEIRNVQTLLEIDTPLQDLGVTLNHKDFRLPADYFSFTNVQVKASQGECRDKLLSTFEVKHENREEIYHDLSNEPSFLYRETFYTIGSDNVNIYFKDFEIDNCYLTYYRYPKSIEIEGYIKADGSQSENINPEWDDKIVDRISTICAKDYFSNNDSVQNFQTKSNQIITKF